MRKKAEGDVHHDYNMKYCYYIKTSLNDGKHKTNLKTIHNENTTRKENNLDINIIQIE